MPNRIHSGIRCGVGSLWLALLVPAAGLAAPLLYNVVPGESNLSTSAFGIATVDVEPDPLNEFPDFAQMTGFSSTTPSFASSATVDVGLPGGFDDGANGITFSDLSIVYGEVLRIASLGSIAVPLGGGAVQPFAFNTSLSSLSIVLDDPFSSTLTPGANPGEYLWAGIANVTLSGELEPQIVIPTVQTITLGPVPFSQSLTIALAGTFSGDSSGTEVTVGIPVDEIQNVDLSLPPIMATGLDPLGLGLVSIDVTFQDFLLVDLTGAIVYQNATPIPEPGTAALLAIGLVALGWRRRS